MPPSAPSTTASVQPSRVCGTTATKREATSTPLPDHNRAGGLVGRTAATRTPDGELTEPSQREGRSLSRRDACPVVSDHPSRTLATTTESPTGRPRSGPFCDSRFRTKPWSGWTERRGDHSSFGFRDDDVHVSGESIQLSRGGRVKCMNASRACNNETENGPNLADALHRLRTSSISNRQGDASPGNSVTPDTVWTVQYTPDAIQGRHDRPEMPAVLDESCGGSCVRRLTIGLDRLGIAMHLQLGSYPGFARPRNLEPAPNPGARAHSIRRIPVDVD